MLICTKWRPFFLKTAHWSLLYCWRPLIGTEFGETTRFSSRLKETMLANLEALMNSYVKNSEVVMLCRDFSGKELRDFFEKKWEMLKNKKIVDVQAFNLKSLLCGSKSNNRIKLNTNETIIFSQSLLLLIRVSLIWKVLWWKPLYLLNKLST